MFCPECRAEYREGFTVCVDCQVALVPELPPEPAEESPPEGAGFEEVLSFMDEGVVAVVKSVLDEEGIEYFIKGEFKISGDPSRKLMVQKDQAERAREILEDLESEDEEPDEIA